MRGIRDRRLLVCVCLAGLLVGCEDGPDQIFKPNPPELDPGKLNGVSNLGHLADGRQPFEFQTSKQEQGTVQICQADEQAKRWAKMVKEPIRPTIGAGGLDLRGTPVWSGLSIDDAQQQMCQAYVYGTEIVYWGDNAEMLAFYDTKTRLIDRLVTLTGYEGTIDAGGFVIANNQPIMKDGSKLQNPDSDDNLRAMNIAMLKKFRKEVKNPEKRDCVAENTCYTLDWFTLKRYVFEDMMLDFATEPEGDKVDHIGINLKRAFELTGADVTFNAPQATAGTAPVPQVTWGASCKTTLGVTWEHVLDNCLGIDPPEKALTRPVWSNEALYADMGGLQLYMQRPALKSDAVIPDDAKPDKADEVVAMGFSTEYGGGLTMSRTALHNAVFAAVADEVKKHFAPLDPKGPQWPANLDLNTVLAQIKPAGDPSKLSIGTQQVEVCVGANCSNSTLTLAVRQLVLSALTQAGVTKIPLELQNANFYVEQLLRQLFVQFNDKTPLVPSDVYFYVGDDSAQIMYGAFVRSYNGKRHAVRAVYHNKSDQLLFLFFKRGSLRTEDVLWKDAELKQFDNQQGDGIFRLWNLAKSPRLGLGKSDFFPTKVDSAIRKATIPVELGSAGKVDVMVNYTKQSSLSGFSIPIEGQRDVFVPAAYYGFSGNIVGAGLYVKDGIVLAVSSGAFYDKVDFCGVKVGMYDKVEDLLDALPASCEKIVSYSDNGKLLTAVSTYVESDPFKIGVRLYVTAGRIDGAYYWAEQ